MLRTDVLACQLFSETEAGSDLADFERFEDGSSARYGIVNVGDEVIIEIDAELIRTVAPAAK